MNVIWILINEKDFTKAVTQQEFDWGLFTRLPRIIIACDFSQSLFKLQTILPPLTTQCSLSYQDKISLWAELLDKFLTQIHCWDFNCFRKKSYILDVWLDSKYPFAMFIKLVWVTALTFIKYFIYKSDYISQISTPWMEKLSWSKFFLSTFKTDCNYNR